MRVNSLLVAGLVVVVCGLFVSGCGQKQAKGPQKIDPHSPDGIMLAMKDQVVQFNGAIARQEYKYLHDYGYYLTGIIVAFNAKIDDAQRKQFEGQIKELLSLTAQLDRAAGGDKAEATAATVKRIEAAVNKLEQEYHQTTGSALTEKAAGAK